MNSWWDAGVERWNRFWFSPGSALNLAAARVIFGGHALWLLGSRDLPALSGVPDAFWTAVPAVDRWRFLVVPGHPALERALEWMAFAALGAAIVGIYPRVACLLAGLLLYHLAALETLYWTPNPYQRGFSVAVPALLTLAWSRCGDRLAIVPRPPSEAADAAEYQWALRLTQFLVCLVYFVAGYSKVARAGFAWAGGENLRTWLMVFGEQDQVWTLGGLGMWIAAQPALCAAIGVSALALDLGFIAILFWARLRPWVLGAAVAFHAGITLTMGIVFLNVPQLLVFVDWARFQPLRSPAPEQTKRRDELIADRFPDRRARDAGHDRARRIHPRPEQEVPCAEDLGVVAVVVRAVGRVVNRVEHRAHEHAVQRTESPIHLRVLQCLECVGGDDQRQPRSLRHAHHEQRHEHDDVRHHLLHRVEAP
jgi:hypothetical protein